MIQSSAYRAYFGQTKYRETVDYRKNYFRMKENEIISFISLRRRCLWIQTGTFFQEIMFAILIFRKKLFSSIQRMKRRWKRSKNLYFVTIYSRFTPYQLIRLHLFVITVIKFYIYSLKILGKFANNTLQTLWFIKKTERSRQRNPKEKDNYSQFITNDDYLLC